MSQSRFSIVLVGVSALLRRPLVSRLRPADGERSSWVVFTARVGRFESGFRSAVGLRAHCFRFSACAASELPLGEFVLPPSVSEITAGRVRSSAFRFGNCPPRVGLRAHRFRFSACAAWGLPLGGLAFGFTASAFRHASLRSCPRRVGSSASCFGVCRSASWFFCLPFRSLLLGGLAFGLTASAFRHALLRSCPRRVGASARRVGLRAHGFCFSACADPHRRAADARTDGAQRHDNCFTSKHLSQHVNLPHRTP